MSVFHESVIDKEFCDNIVKVACGSTRARLVDPCCYDKIHDRDGRMKNWRQLCSIIFKKKSQVSVVMCGLCTRCYDIQ